MRIRVLILLFLLVGAFFIVSNNDLHLNSKYDLQKFVGLYYSWLSGLFDNLKVITGYVIKSDWLPSSDRITNAST